MTPLQKRFVREYLVDLNATQAAIRCGSKAKDAGQAGSAWYTTPAIRAEIDAALARRSAKVEVRAEDVLRSLVRTVRADPRKLTEIRRTCCRHCYGWEHEHQRTERELRRDRAMHEVAQAAVAPAKRKPFDELGGDGWDPRRDPNPDCPECFGAGVLHTHFADTRELDDDAAALYRGVKVTSNGLEVLMADQDKARELLGRHLGMFRDKLELTGKLSWEHVLGLAEKPEGDGL